MAHGSSRYGGTFTDIVLERGSERWSRKLLTTHAAPERALLRGIEDILHQAGTDPRDVSWFVHGTTLATNALIERRGARTALLTTEFRDVLEIGYEGRYDPMDLRLEKRPPLVPRELRFTVAERLSARGEVLIPLDEHDLASVVDVLRASEIESLAIGFLHAYADPRHERLARDVIGSRCQDLSISLSSDICPEIREYERISTVVANAYIQPFVTAYLDRVAVALARIGFVCPVMLMASGGGLMPLDLAKRVPVRLVVRLKTGATHQIRAQLAREGLPLVGDSKYGGPPAPASARCDRPALHARRLVVPHPVGGAPVNIGAPVPDDLRRLDRALGLSSAR